MFLFMIQKYIKEDNCEKSARLNKKNNCEIVLNKKQKLYSEICYNICSIKVEYFVLCIRCEVLNILYFHKGTCLSLYRNKCSVTGTG